MSKGLCKFIYKDQVIMTANQYETAYYLRTNTDYCYMASEWIRLIDLPIFRLQG